MKINLLKSDINLFVILFVIFAYAFFFCCGDIPFNEVFCIGFFCGLLFFILPLLIFQFNHFAGLNDFKKPLTSHAKTELYLFLFPLVDLSVVALVDLLFDIKITNFHPMFFIIDFASLLAKSNLLETAVKVAAVFIFISVSGLSYKSAKSNDKKWLIFT